MNSSIQRISREPLHPQIGKKSNTRRSWLRCFRLLESVYVHIIIALVSLFNLTTICWNECSSGDLLELTSEALVLLQAAKNIQFAVLNTKALNLHRSKIENLAERLAAETSSRKMNLLFMNGFLIHIGSYILSIWTLNDYSYYRICSVYIPWFVEVFYMYACAAQIGAHTAVPEQCFVAMEESVLASSCGTTEKNPYDELVCHHDVLLEYCEKVNEWFDVRIFLNIGFCFVGMLNEFSQSLIVEKLLRWEIAYPKGWLETFIAGVLYGSIIVTLVQICNTVAKQAEKFNRALCSLAVRDTSGKIVSNPHIQAHFAISRKVQFRLLGAFDINSRFGCTLLAALLTTAGAVLSRKGADWDAIWW